MAGEAQGLALGREAEYAQLVGDAGIVVAFAYEEAEFTLGRQDRLVGVFDNRGEGGIGHGKSALAAPLELVGEHAQGVGVTLEVGQVGPLAVGEPVAEVASGTFAEEGADGAFAAVAEWGIAEVVGEACGGHDVAEVVEVLDGHTLGEVPFAQGHGDIVGHRLAHAGNFHAVREPVVDEYAARQGEDLGLVLQPAERCRKYQTVVVAFELRAVVVPLNVSLFLTEPFVGYELFPVHSRIIV